MKKGDTLRRLIREAVLVEMGEMWRYGRVGDARMGEVVDRDYVNTVYFEGTPAECQEFIEENYTAAPEIYMGKDDITYKVVGVPPYRRILDDYFDGANVSSKARDEALNKMFKFDMKMPGYRVALSWFGGPIVVKGPAGDETEWELDALANMFYGFYPKGRG